MVKEKRQESKNGPPHVKLIHELLPSLIQLRLTGVALSVLLGLFYFMKMNDLTVHFTPTRLGKLIGIDNRSVGRGLKELEDQNLMVRLPLSRKRKTHCILDPHRFWKGYDGFRRSATLEWEKLQRIVKRRM